MDKPVWVNNQVDGVWYGFGMFARIIMWVLFSNGVEFELAYALLSMCNNLNGQRT